MRAYHRQIGGDLTERKSGSRRDAYPASFAGNGEAVVRLTGSYDNYATTSVARKYIAAEMKACNIKRSVGGFK